MNSNVWFITNTSLGFGHVWTEVALQCSDMVATREDIMGGSR